MPQSSRPPTPGPSRTPSPELAPATTYRIERFDASHLPADLMVTSRSKRSTAGNRLKALLDQELEKDEVFAEVENDIDFEANEVEDGVDIVDSDFDRESDDDARPGAEDESEGEREIEAQEKADKQKRRAQTRAAGIIKRPNLVPTAAQRATRRTVQPSVGPVRETKRRKISFAPTASSSSPSRSSPSADSPAAAARRASARSATVQSKLQVESRLEEASLRRAAQPVKVVAKKKASLTQDALIAEALEVEEENRESLRKFLEQEEERRAKQRQRKERITGPFVRWMSVGLKTRVVQDDAAVANGKGKEKEHSAGEQVAAETVHRVGQVSPHGSTGPVDSQSTLTLNTRPDHVEASKLPPSQTQQKGIEEQGEQGTQPSPGTIKHDDGASRDTPAPPAVQAEASEREEKPTSTVAQEVSKGPLLADEANKAAASGADVRSARESSMPAPAGGSGASLTLDPAIAARQQAALLRSGSSSSKPLPMSGSSSSRAKFEMQARTLLSVERAPDDWEWLDEFNVLLGSHTRWDSYPFVPSRNRPLKPRQSICPITGLPAIYKDPRTGIPYATAQAYKIITQLLENRYIWTGGHYRAQPPERAREKDMQQHKNKPEPRGVGGKVGVGAVPPEMGIYLDAESEPGPAKVWQSARTNAPAKSAQPCSQTPVRSSRISSSPTKHPASSPTPSATPTAAGAGEQSDEWSRRKKSKPGFDVVLTNALAPGDEKAVLAAALSLPAGSTRSGRRVHRS